MPSEPVRGRLIAVEAVRGRDVERGAADVRHAIARKRSGIKAGISHWDASGAFFELRCAGRKALTLAPRTLLLLYASDLAFRLRWEIEPALAGGQIVIAASYLDTAIAFGEAAGLPRKWIAEVLRFAPSADVCLHVADTRAGGWKRRPMDGFPEFGAMALAASKQGSKDAPRRDHAVAALRALRRTGVCDDLRKKTLASLVKSLRRNRLSPPSTAR
jgi:hypothetical protein